MFLHKYLIGKVLFLLKVWKVSGPINIYVLFFLKFTRRTCKKNNITFILLACSPLPVITCITGTVNHYHNNLEVYQRATITNAEKLNNIRIYFLPIL